MIIKGPIKGAPDPIAREACFVVEIFHKDQMMVP